MMTAFRCLQVKGGPSPGEIPQMRQGLAAWCATGAGVFRPHYLTLLSAVYGKAGLVEQEWTALTEALEIVKSTGERWWEAEIHRIKGELLLRRASPTEEVEDCFRQALAMAQHQQAKSLELRAAMSLARLWQQQGKRAEARELLAPIYGWFTEGFDTADLQEAKALLDALA